MMVMAAVMLADSPIVIGAKVWHRIPFLEFLY
jgi:hypothetical protein